MQIIYTPKGKSKKEKITKARQEELERDWRERNQRLKSMGLSKETFEQFVEWVYGRGKKEKTKEKHVAKSTSTITKKNAREEVKMDSFVSKPADRSTLDCALKPIQKYTGSAIIGIGVLHKSCLQPIFNQESAEDIAKMRR